MSDDAVQTVKRLIALSASDSKEEARTAAFKACELIRKHKLEVSAPDLAPSPFRATGAGATKNQKSVTADDFEWAGGVGDVFSEFIRQQHRAAENMRTQPLTWESAAPRSGWPSARMFKCQKAVVCFRCRETIEQDADMCSVQVRRRTPYFVVDQKLEDLDFHADCYPNRSGSS